MTRRAGSVLGSILFVFYCGAVGVYLLLRPWSTARGLVGLPSSGFFRGFVSGLGLVHIAVAIADLRSLSRDLSAPGEAPGTDAP
jgi:hypothetical protein